MKTKKYLLKRKSKSFYFASIFLSKETFNNCSVLYSFCRQIDDIADNKQPNKEKKLKNILKSIININDSNNKIDEGIKLLINSKVIEKKCLIELVQGVLLDTRKTIHLSNEIALINYSYLVAGTVGIMMAKLLSNKLVYAYRYAVDLGIAMQLTNILRDILEDASIGRVYFPKSWINITPEKILKRTINTKNSLNRISQKIYDLSEIYYKSAMKGMAFLPFRSRFAILLALNIYRQIGEKIIKNNYSNLIKRESVYTYEKIFCLIKVCIIFIFNINIHIKKYEHDKSLHDKINNNTFLKTIIYEKR
ncbi:MAG: phytoene synthase [Pelagibacterales bacterium]|nr:phytoene synthase [Pelagibacterales bacterium]OUU63341.1 MAG: hypothetical protein CBC22_01495 [Alphaproteobacteria bacterium TMED62]